MTTNNKPEFWVVTGAASGIGAAVVRAVKKSGANVLALDVDQSKGIALAEETGALYRHCDVGDLTQWQQLIEYLESEQADLGAPTRIHLNAGIQIAPPEAPLPSPSPPMTRTWPPPVPPATVTRPPASA